MEAFLDEMSKHFWMRYGSIPGWRMETFLDKVGKHSWMRYGTIPG
jgi:hypothetical protein